MIQLNSKQKLSVRVLAYTLIQYFLGVCIALALLLSISKSKIQIEPWVNIIVLFLFVPIPLYYFLWWKFFSFTVSEQGVIIDSGVIFKENKMVNFNDLQNIKSSFGPILFIFGLRKVQGFTSSPGQLIITSVDRNTTTSYMPDVSIILEKDTAQEFLNLARRGDIQKVQQT